LEEVFVLQIGLEDDEEGLMLVLKGILEDFGVLGGLEPRLQNHLESAFEVLLA